ncbi:MAG: anti-sigma F factor [Syntrophomonas sp.]
MNVKNYVRFEFLSVAENVSFARSCVAAFASQLDCTLDDVEEIKLVVSEAVSNCIIHGYDNRQNEKIEVMVSILDDRTLEIMIKDFGKGIEDLKRAMEPSYSTEHNRMGLGFTFMKSFMDEMEVVSQPGEGTSVKLKRSFLAGKQEAYA